MSGLAGLWNLDGSVADPAVLGRMLESARHRGPDAAVSRCRGPIAMGQTVLRTTLEPAGERVSMCAGSQVWFSFDGRLDNREELSDALSIARSALRATSDAELVLAAYQRHGGACARMLLGDFAFALWDERRRALVCARDPLGIRPLVYARAGRRMVWASEVKQLFASGLIDPAPNPGVIGEFLSYQPTDLEETLYLNVRRVPPAHTLTVSPEAMRIERYVDFDPSRAIRYRDDREYAEHFAEIFGRAVSARLRADGPVSIFLSGGVDSSAIAGVAGHERRARPGSRVQLLSLASSHPDADECSYARSVAEICGLPSTMVSADGFEPPHMDAQVRADLDLPLPPNSTPWQRLYERMHGSGSRVVLWGHGGDEWLTGDASHCADLLAAGEVRRAIRQLRDDLAVSNAWGGGGVGLRDVWRWTLLPLVPRPIKRLARPLVARRIAPWIARRLARQIDLAGRLRRRPRAHGFRSIAQRAIHAQLTDGWMVFEREMLDRVGARFSVEHRFPLHDRRIVDFALAIPESQRWRGTETKFVLRRACHHVLPTAVLERRSKADFSYLFVEMIERERAGERFARLRLAEDGYVDAAAARRTFEHCRAGSRRDLDAVWIILTLESWYRTMFDGGLRDRPRQAPEAA